jgi:hypothetical protein
MQCALFKILPKPLRQHINKLQKNNPNRLLALNPKLSFDPDNNHPTGGFQRHTFSEQQQNEEHDTNSNCTLLKVLPKNTLPKQ